MYTKIVTNSITMHKSMPKFYDYNDQKYSICFPVEWATNHYEKTGPHECINCLHYGCTDNIFTNYCINCQEYEYNFTRIVGNYSTAYYVHSYNDSDSDITDDDYNSDNSVNSNMYISSVMPLFTYNNTSSHPIMYQDDGPLHISPIQNILCNT